MRAREPAGSTYDKRPDPAKEALRGQSDEALRRAVNQLGSQGPILRRPVAPHACVLIACSAGSRFPAGRGANTPLLTCCGPFAKLA
jgi:hypothetical protein